MPFKSRKARLELTSEARERLGRLANSRTEKHARVMRARMLLAFAEGKNISAIARELKESRDKVDRCIRKALSQGWESALQDLPRRGRPRTISDEAVAWVVELACRKPTELGYASELWTYRELAKHVRRHAAEAGFPELQRAGTGLVHQLLHRSGVRPHKVRYYLEQRDPDFAAKKARILVVYKEVALLNESKDPTSRRITTVCIDEKPNLQALGTTRPDRPPEPGKQRHWGRNMEYVRLGTVSLLGGIDLHTGQVLGIVRERHRSREFIELLQLLDSSYPEDWRIRLILDNHSSHTSKETQQYLETRPNRFELVFTPTHASWLNLVEALFSKMTRSFLRGIRVSSKEELGARILRYFDEINADPVVFRWKYQLEEPV